MENKLIIPEVKTIEGKPQQEYDYPIYGKMYGDLFVVYSPTKSIKIYGTWVRATDYGDKTIVTTLEYDNVRDGKPFEIITKQQFDEALGTAINKILDLNNDNK